MRFFLMLVLILNLNVIYGQVVSNNRGSIIGISGEVEGKALVKDSIYFNTGVIDKKYYEVPYLSSKIENNEFFIETQLSYPHMYRNVFASDKDVRIWRLGNYFIDPSTSYVKTNYLSDECNEIDGQTFNEYQNEFIPFVFAKSGGYSCAENDMYKISTGKSLYYDSLLFDYVIGNPNSYTALWSLIERFSLFGHSTLRATMLNKFSDDMKSTKLWTILNYDVINSKIKEDHKFPLIIGKTLQLEEQKIALPKAQYILIDFWFSRCIPCLEAFPFLKELYANYRSKGFEIISISTDKTKELPLWKKRINDYELPWAQYWDENGTEAKNLAIHRFPSTLLLDSGGNLIRKNISPQDLELFLKMHLGKK